MSFFLSFASDHTDEITDEITDTDEVGTTRGWHDFSEWAAGLDEERFPALTFFVEEGGVGEAEDMAQLEEELAEALHARPGSPSRDVLSVGQRLLHELRGRPEDSDAVVVTDGTEGKGE
jgi:hypothetical protein